MRHTLLLIALGATAMAPPKVKPPTVSATMAVAGDSLKVKWTISASPSDSLTVDVSATTGTAKHKKYVVTTKTDSLNVAKPAPGASVTISLLATNWRFIQGANKSASAPLAQGTYIEPDTTVAPPTVQLQLIPASGAVSTGGQIQFAIPS